MKSFIEYVVFIGLVGLSLGFVLKIANFIMGL